MALRLRPVLDHRMPTLGSKTAFLMPFGDISAHPKRRNALKQLESSPPRCLKEVRNMLTSENKYLAKRLARLERAYYGDSKTIHQEIEKYSLPVKSAMKGALIFQGNSAASVDMVIRLTADSKSYKGSKDNSAMFKEVYNKIQNFIPDKMTDISDSCQKLLEYLEKYCVSFYDPGSEQDGYLETADHYEEQIRTWKTKIEASFVSARSLYKRFKSKGITLSHLSPPVATFATRQNLDKVLFLVIFADICTNIRNALTLMMSWLQADENYAVYIRNDVIDLEALKEEKIKALREARQRFHSLTFRVSQLEIDRAKLEAEISNLSDRRDALKTEESAFSKEEYDMELEIEFKEYRRDGLKKAVDINPELTSESYDLLTSDLKNLKERLPLVQKQLATIRYKLQWVEIKDHELEKTEQEIETTKRDLKEADEERQRREKEFVDIERSLELARKILLCKTSNDAVEKIYYSIPVALRNSKVKGETRNSHPLDKAGHVLATMIEKDWMNLYRNLPFHPKRGAQTIERDIIELSSMGARSTLVAVAKCCLDRWRRHHTRAKVSDLHAVLKRIKRHDISRAIEFELNPPVKTEESLEIEEQTPPVPPELVPFYEMGERYDYLRAIKRL